MHRHELSLDAPTSATSRSPLTRASFSAPGPSFATTGYQNSLPIIHRPHSDYFIASAEHTVRFQEDVDTMSEETRSIGSENSEATAGGGRTKRRSSKPSTQFALAHPAPTLTQKQRVLQIRPRLLLQLQRLSANARPRPALDVVPSTVVVPRLAKRFPRIFRNKGELGANDVMVVKSEEYDVPQGRGHEDADSDGEAFEARDLIAVICQLPKDEGGSQGKAEIVLSDGSIWVASPLSNGSYEFSRTLENGDKITARWVKRTRIRADGHVAAASNDRKFTFSIIDPTTRRHPILGTITQRTLDIPDSFTSVASSSGRLAPTSPVMTRPMSLDGAYFAETRPERQSHMLDENTKTLIEVTGIWLSLREGWCPYFTYNDACGCSSADKKVGSQKVRSVSTTPEPTIRTSTPESAGAHSTFGAVGEVIRRKVTKSGLASPSPQLDGIVPRRALSTGTHFMQRAANRKINNYPYTIPSDSEGDDPIYSQSRAATDSTMEAASNGLKSPEGSITPSETPPRIPKGRVRSGYTPTSALQHGYSSGERETGSFEHQSKPAPVSAQFSTKVAKQRAPRWKAFTQFFRRHTHAAA